MAVASKDEYVKMDEMYEGQTYKMSANTLMTWPGDIDGSRLYMSTSETKQHLTLLNPDVPRLSTGWENPLGKLNVNRSYKKLEGKWEVRDIIRKFKNGEIYTLVLYNPDEDKWDMIEKQVCESLGEKYGFFYNTSRMDALNVGDVVEDEIIYKSTSYDDHMNYRYGKNAKVYYTTSTDTLEDAVKIRKGWADGVNSVEVDDVYASVNNNHIPLNLYGKEKGEYKVCPDFGEPIQNSCVFVLRPLKTDRILTDFKNEALCHVNFTTDTDYYISECKEACIYDIDIYYNGEDPFPDNVFFHQLHGYYEEICAYVDKMNEWATFIKNSGCKYTDNIPYYKSIYQHYNDPEWKFCGKEKNKPFGYMTIVFHVKEILGIVPGSKASGRFGDKGVVSKIADDPTISKMMVDGTIDSILDMLGKPINEEERAKLAGSIEIVPDEEFPYTDKFKIDILLNASGAIRRLNPGQIDELDINFQSECIREKVCELETLEEKEKLIFEYLHMINDAECDFFYNMYKGFDHEIKIDDQVSVIMENRKEKERFIHDIEEHGFYIRKEHDRPIRYEAICAIYEKFDFIKPLPLYIDIFGTKRRRIIKDGIVADKYMMILKHNSNKNFSARSTFRINRAGLPVKDTTKRDNRSQYSRSPVRIGEAYNIADSISGRLLADAGHSLGEYAALTAAGAFSLEDGFRVIGARAAAMQRAADANPGSMFAIVGSDEQTVSRVCEETPGYLLPVNFNSLSQTVIAGEVEAAQAAADRLAGMGAKAVKLAVSSAFHSRMMAPAAEEFRAAIADVKTNPLSKPFYSNLNAKPLDPDTDLVEYLATHLISPVRFHEEVSAMLSDGIERFVELGPNKVLTMLVKRGFKQASAMNVENLKTLEKLKGSL